eukprot:3661405-Heterocapsa_arctica.AAC.1
MGLLAYIVCSIVWDDVQEVQAEEGHQDRGRPHLPIGARLHRTDHLVAACRVLQRRKLMQEERPKLLKAIEAVKQKGKEAKLAWAVGLFIEQVSSLTEESRWMMTRRMVELFLLPRSCRATTSSERAG